MGAGKTTIGREAARLLERPFVDLDAEIEQRHGPIPALFEHGEAEFRRLEEEVLAEVLAGDRAVIALGGGAVLSGISRERLWKHAYTVLIEVDVKTAWERAHTSDRPLARDRAAFERLFWERQLPYFAAMDEPARDVDGVLLACLRIDLARGALARELAKAEAPLALVADERVLALHRPALEFVSVHGVPAGEAAKSLAVVERVLENLTLERGGVIVGLGGGSTTDVAGFVAATYLRGVHWMAAPTTLVGQVDAAIGGKTGVNLASGKNLAGAFHLPARVIADPDVLATLPERERRNGMAEVVKTGLLAGRPFWDLPEDEMIRGCAAFKAAVVISDPYEQEGRRTILNLGHTFAHALEAGSKYAVPHGEAVGLGLLAALRLSGLPTDVVEEMLQPQPVRADPDAAWAALKRDKKGEGVFVLLEEPGKPVVTTVPDRDARRALDALIAK
jgi:shikimate kinase/3-dehydroquinate synthase